MKFISGLLLISSTLFLISCKKDSPKGTSVTNNECTLKTFNLGYVGSTITLNYDAQKRIIGTSGDHDPHTDNVFFTYTYSGNALTETMDIPYPGQTYQIINTLNSDGLTTKRVYTGTNESEVVTFEYNGTQLSKAIQKKVSYGDVTTYTYIYTWSGGNLISSNSTTPNGNQILNFSYYTDQPNRQGDYFFNNLYRNSTYDLKSMSFLNTLSVRNKNLLKSVTDGNNSLQLVYSFDDKNNISSISSVGFAVPFYKQSQSFTYDCN